MRETSGRLEEIPGEEGFPAYLDSSIKALYERAGLIETNDRTLGSLTMIGTVSPAGGNFDEPVTQATLSTVKCFLGLSADRAYKRFYPAVDPLISWSRYLDQMQEWFDKNLEPEWTKKVNTLGEVMVSPILYSGWNDAFYGQWLVLYRPWRIPEDIWSDQALLVPESHKNLALCLILVPNNWGSMRKIRDDIYLEAHREEQNRGYVSHDTGPNRNN